MYDYITDFLPLRRAVIERDFARMNDRQREAVFHTDGALLILAGAGSGKTTVLVNRIANLVKYGRGYHARTVPSDLTAADTALLRECAAGNIPAEGRAAQLCAMDPCPAWRILAITFTNKAAGELKERLTRMLGEEGNEVTAGTFHSFCARILRRDGERLGYSSHFTIYDTDDSRRLMKECMKVCNVEEKVLGHKAILSLISQAKDELITPEAFAANAGSDFRMKMAAECYRVYQRRLKEADALDFDDLLCKTVELFLTCPDVLEHYQNRYRYIMVDEYQDTNHVQYQLVSLLAKKYGNLCVVGDDDQSIYKFRGATIENILSFEKQFPDCAVIRLEQNYRSTQNILDAANAVISHNLNRKGKTLWTQNPVGDRIQLHTVESEEAEGRLVADTVLDGVRQGRRYSDFAVLYRANAQSNAIERALVKSGVPYRIIGGHRFFDSQEVRDAMAYLRIISNPDDSVSLRRIINVPRRGIGDTTMDNAAQIAEGLGLPLYEVLKEADTYPAIARANAKIQGFLQTIEELRSLADDETTSLDVLYTTMLERTGYLAMWQEAGPTEEGRVENLTELASSIKDYLRNSPEDAPSLAGFLEEAALMTDADNYDASADAMVLMTMHAAKGLEFPVVFLPGWEDGVFPGMATIFDPSEMEEERRLCYVAITRAREQLHISKADCRMLYGQTTRNSPSRFLRDIPHELLEEHDKTFSHASGYGGFSGGFGDGFARHRWSDTSAGSTYTQQAPAKRYADFAKKPAANRFSNGFGQAVSAAPQKPAATAGGVQSWQVGDRAKHATFGAGTITAIKPMGNDSLLTVQFDTVGVKKIMANFAKLTREDT